MGSFSSIATNDGTTVTFQQQYKQTADGLAANLVFYSHEIRHTEGNGYPHVTGCSAVAAGVAGYDQTYDETNLSAYGIQYYLAKQMVTGGINLGYSCDPVTQATEAAKLQTLANAYVTRFLSNVPASVNVTGTSGGACVSTATFSLGSLPSKVSAGANFTLPITSSNGQAGWTAASTVPWISVNSGANSTGSGQAIFAISQTPGTTPGTVIAAGIAATVTCGATCSVATQTSITFNPLPNVAFGVSPFVLRASVSSALPVSFTSTTPSVCQVAGSTVTIIAVGICSITASQAGNAVYSAATPVTQSFTVTGSAPQAISFSQLPLLSTGAPAFSIAPAASSGLPVTLTSTTPSVCTVAGTTVSILASGTCSITATQAGSGTYAAAAPVTQSFPVLSSSQNVWTINLTFADGGSATGFFALESSTNKFTNWDIVTSGGNTGVFFPFEFTPANSTLGLNRLDTSGQTIVVQSLAQFPDVLPGIILPEALFLSATLAAPLVKASGTIKIQPYSVGNFSYECLNCSPSRFIASGSVNPGYQAPAIAAGGVVPVGSTIGTVQSGQWVSIYGTNLSTSTAIWKGDFPTSLGGTSVTVDGKPAYIWYASPGQINIQIPDDSTTGNVPVVVTTANGTFATTVTLAPVAPTFLLLDSKHVAGIVIHADGTYSVLGPTGSSLGYPTVAAKAGEAVTLFAGGFGPTNPSVPSGKPFSGAAPTVNPVQLTIGSKSITPIFAGLSGAGLAQINFVVPAGLGSGDLPLTALVGGAQTQTGLVISLQ